MYSQPTIHQRPQCPPSYPSSLVNARDHQLASSSTLPTSLFFTRDGPSHTNPQHPSHSQSHTSSSTTTTVLPPVSTLRPSRLKAETTPTMTATQLPSQVSPASPGSSPVTPCVKIEYDSPREIHSHFHCDFSPIHFWLDVCVCVKILFVPILFFFNSSILFYIYMFARLT